MTKVEKVMMGRSGFRAPAVFFLICALVESLLPLSVAQAWAVSVADKYGKVFGNYTTKSVNTAIERATDKQDQTAKLVVDPDHFEKSNFDFSCPGYSLLTGVTSRFVDFDGRVDKRQHSSDRTFTFTCSFLEDPQDQLLIKHSCDTDSGPADNEDQKPGQSACEAESQFVNGMISEKYRSTDGAQEGGEKQFFRDRLYKTRCCQLRDLAGTAIRPTKLCTKSSFRAGSDFSLQCNEGFLLTRIESVYDPDTWDRAYTFYCCKAESG
ncbi:MAG: hypothetical protein H6618_05585 [Deltaproteobacteria bacterium]|nr:hypothetical protein [Deltaproteobacteria bacterium]